jgi:hypothetical protein
MVKKEYLVQELGLEAVELMRRIKVLTPTHLKLISQLALDPLELLNPGLTLSPPAQKLTYQTK